jgi:hypothetical protein
MVVGKLVERAAQEAARETLRLAGLPRPNHTPDDLAPAIRAYIASTAS